MPPISTIYACSQCGAQFPKWQGRCNECGAWGTIVQEIRENKKPGLQLTGDQPVEFSAIGADEQIKVTTKIAELDRVLGGGIVAGSLILLGGDPGIGKSTLALQIAQSVNNTLYISGEESARQVKLRADRLNADLTRLKFVPQTGLEKIIATIKEQRPELVIIDSIQTINSAESAGAIGSVAQITTSAGRLMETAKLIGVPIIIIGHVTKEGLVAGPRALEHLVDTVLYLENDNRNFYKIVRSVKNRFGAVGEIGVFEMTAGGLREVSDPANIFLEQHRAVAPGSAVSVVLEGSRPFLVELQALAAKTAFGYPQRKATGFDLNRLQLIIAVLAKIAKINLANHDIYLNVAGGMKIKETATDLAAGLAIVSAFYEKPLSPQTLVIGEIGLAGEIRSVPQLERRIKEAAKLKFTRVITALGSASTHPAGLDLATAANIQEAIKLIA